MLVVISPAKTLDFDTPPHIDQHTQPDFLKQSRQLIGELQQLNPEQISSLMSISGKLGELNHQRFMNWKTPFKPTNAKPAALAFRGDVYTGLDADSLTEDDFAFAQDHLRILSGLYGLLRPLDLIQPYRLEMGTRFQNTGGDNLYQFWGDRLTQALNKQLKEAGPVLINLASKEYFSAVQPGKLNADVITPVFKDCKNGKYKIISFYAKKARGLMSAYIIKHRLTDPEGLKAFDSEGYYFSPEQSTAREWVFLREEA
ncbi:peroxide stress protein YaaA [Spongiibacter taiwanensis]|uniref:peroxide stress protein YaaA n=1 Tax=Spongiibacter taiwanensis TaxID=1748242 RepID=UPI0020354EB6|nr:peroxide stress protein YaaA [Spongiibacter taiwanensis]USA41659.1 peroxide stress protein YaaA [Spongiibacter taiwanensis]